MSETTSNNGGDNHSLIEDGAIDCSGDSVSLSEFPPVEERSGPEGAEEDVPDNGLSGDLEVSEGDEDENDEDDENYDSVPPTIERLTSSQMLPWGAPKERTRFPSTVNIETDIRPGEFVMRTLFAEFTIQAEKKINTVMSEPIERPLSKSLQRGEFPQFDQLLSSFGSVAEHCLPSLLKTLFAWYDRQGVEWIVSDYKGKGDSKGKSELSHARSELEFMSEKRDLAVEFIFCLVLVEVLKQLSVHPGHEDLVQHIENIAFKHFRYRDSQILGPNCANIHIIADLYAEVLGVLAQSRFLSTKKKFFTELRELRSREPSTHTTQSIISLLMGMKFFRVKMVPFEDFEHSFQFMHELAQYFLEVKDKDIKHAVAGLFVEILVPVAAAVKNEVNVPCLKNFVEKLYSQTLDMCTRSKHRLAIFPLVTCLLCVSQKVFFLHNWHYFLTMCLQHLKNRDTKMARVALESLYRLLWVYMIRIKCESNNVTQSRLQSIVNSLFPKGSKAVVPRDTPLNIFVKIIQFIAQEKLDFSMREIVFDLLSVGRPIKVINAPERMSIGLRAFLVVADSLQQKEGEPPMPRTVGVMPSGSTLRVKKTFLSKMLTEDTAKAIGLSHYYPYVRKVFDDILRALDAQFGKPYLLTNSQNANKEADNDAKPKLDLFRTVIAAIPRLIPDGMSRSELVDTLSRLTVHNDEELRGLAYNSLQNLVIDFPDWREDVLYGFMQFVVKDVSDQQTTLLDNSLRIVHQLLNAWKNAVDKVPTKSSDVTRSDGNRPDLATTLHMAEAFALVMLCHIRLALRKLALNILKEVKQLFKLLGALREDLTVLDALDKTTASVCKLHVHLMPQPDKSAVTGSTLIEFQWLADRNSSQWTAGFNDEGMAKSGSTQHLFNFDPWSACLISFLHPDRLPSMCPSAIVLSWPIINLRLSQLFTVVDPAPPTDNRASLLRPGTAPKRILNEKDISMHLWKNYTIFACRVVPPIPNPVIRCVSPDLMLSSSPESLGIIDRSSDNKSPSPMVSPTVLYKLLVPLLRCEVSDMRDSVVHALGSINHTAIMDLMSEMVIYIREAIDRKQENMRRRRRRDALRLQLVRVLKIMAEEKTFSRAKNIIDHDTGCLAQNFIEYIDGMRSCLEAEIVETIKDNLSDIKIHFAEFMRLLIESFSLETRRNLFKKDLRRNLFYLFAGWSGKFGSPFAQGHFKGPDKSGHTDFEFSALQAMVSVLCSGPTFDNSITEEPTLYTFLNSLLLHEDLDVYNLAQSTIVLLLEFNPDIPTLLDWVVDRCFTGIDKVADGCFLALATIFATREYPCDHYTAIINVTLLNTGCPRSKIYETALQLLQILDKRFFGSETFGQDRGRSTLDVLLSTTYSRSQRYLSRQLAQIHPELTMPMFSEICHRLQTARPPVIKCLLYYLLPWLYNLELVDPNVAPDSTEIKVDPQQSRGREGWGSSEATEMITNNLFYITVKFGNDHPKEIEELWAAMVACWPKNLRVIIRYLLIISAMAPTELIEYAKRVVLYLGRAQPVKTLDELMVELQTVETLNCMIERTETPPFYRLTSLRKTSSNSESTVQLNASRQDLATEKGTIHTKRHSQEDPQKDVVSKTELTLTGSLRSAGSMASSAGSAMVAGIQRVGEKVRALSGSTNLIKHEVPIQIIEDVTIHMDHSQIHQGEDRDFNVHPPVMTTSSLAAFSSSLPQQPSSSSGSANTTQAQSSSALENHLHPLPMPEYGGWFAPLTEFLPEPSQPISTFHRCNLAVILLTDLVVDGLDLDCHSVDWSVHVPLMLHIIFLGLDNGKEIVHKHCHQLLLNLLIVVGRHNDHLTISKILMNSKTDQMNFGLSLPSLPILQHNFIEKPVDSDSGIYRNSEDASGTISEEDEAVQVAEATMKPSIRMTDANGEPVLDPLSQDTDVADVTKALINFISSRKCLPLWQYEDITKNLWSIKSAEQLDIFLQHVLRVFEMSLPLSHLAERWSQLALLLALSCSSRHYAGRSLQIFRALRVPITSRMLSDVLSRLVETIAEPGEDMQGYVTELFLTLEAVVDALDSDFRPMDLSRDIFKSTPNLKDMASPVPRRTSPLSNQSKGGTAATSPTGGPTASSPIGHVYHASAPPTGPYSKYERSHSYNYPASHHAVIPFPLLLKSVSPNTFDMRGRSSTETDGRQRPVHQSSTNSLARSRSAQSLKIQDQTSQDDKLNILVQLFWICLAVFESDYEHEFLLGLRLLDKVLNKLPLDRPDVRERVEKLYHQLKWGCFPGVHSLLLKGCTNLNTYEPTIQALSRFTLLLDFNVVDPSQSLAFPMNVMALLPYMVQNYEDANETCIISAENIAQVCTEKNKKLENLATVMTLYSRRTFSKESFQWTKCVVKYLYDLYSHFSFNMLGFLVEVLEKGPPTVQSPVLTIIHCLLHYVDMTASTQTINADLLRTVAKFIETLHWKESLKILKLAVTRSSTLVAPPSSSGISYNWDNAPGSNFAEADIYYKKELPGRTMEFTFDLSQTPVIGRRQRPSSGGSHYQPQHYSTASSAMSASDYGSYSVASTATIHSALASASSTSNVSGVSGLSTRDQKDIKDSILTRSLTGSMSNCGTIRDLGEGATASTLSPRRSLSSTQTEVTSSTAGWKRPWMSQSTVRERLVNLLNTCGQRIGLPKSPSGENLSNKVIFSQTSENLERQSSMASSTEEVSGTNDVSTESKQHDTTDTEQKFGMYMREFDFLEYELESLEGESIDNFNWGVRRPSLSHLDGGNGSGHDGELSSTQESFNEVTPVLPKRDSSVGIGAEESSDDEIGSITEMSDRNSDENSGASSSISTTSSGVFPPNSLDLHTKRLSCTTPLSEPESDSSDDNADESDHDLTPCNPSPDLTQLLGWGERQGRSNDQEDGIDEGWRCHVHTVQSNPTSKNLVTTFLAFGKLFEDIKTKTCVLTQDAVVQLVRTSLNPDHVNMAKANLQQLTDALSADIRYPFVWVNLESLGGGKLMERAKFIISEIQENFENYSDKKDATLECLDGIKVHQKLLSLGEQLSTSNIDHDQIDLCRCLYKLYMQLLLLLDSFTKLIRNVTQAPAEGLIDRSKEVAAIQIGLIDAVKFQTFEAVPECDLAHVANDELPEYRRQSSENDNQVEEQIISIPGEEDLPVRTPTPEELEFDPTVESGVSDLQRIQIDDLDDQESSVDSTPAHSLELTDSVAGSDDLNNVASDRSTDTVTEAVDSKEHSAEFREEEERKIVQLIQGSQYVEAVQAYRRLRRTLSNFPLDFTVGGPTHEDEVWSLLNIYCTHIAGGNIQESSIFVLTVSDGELSEHCSELMDLSLQLLSAVKLMDAYVAQMSKMMNSAGPDMASTDGHDNGDL